MSDDVVALADVAPMGFKRVSGGSFRMGSPDSEPGRSSDERLHTVAVSGFEIGTTEVTLAQWRAVMGEAPSGCKVDCVDDHPMEALHWEMAIEFLNRLTDRENLGHADAKLSRCYEQRDGAWAWVQGCTGYRLPSEAEWEYAARAGTTTAYSFGEDPALLPEYAWYLDNSMSNAQSVGQKRPNPWGLYDMHGNVQEWVWDDSIDMDQMEGKGSASDAVIKDPRGPDGRGGGGRVLRGGAFYMTAAELRSAARFSFGSVYEKMSYTGGGFRCARSGPRRG